jgi:hypothetical protein
MSRDGRGRHNLRGLFPRYHNCLTSSSPPFAITGAGLPRYALFFQPTSARLALDLDVATETGRKVMAANML